MQQKFGLNIPRTLEEICDPARMALLVYDMQVGVVSQIRNGPEITLRVSHLLQAARVGGFRAFFNRYMTLPKEVAGVFQLRMAMDWQHVNSIDKLQSRFTPQLSGISDCFGAVTAHERSGLRQNCDVRV